MFDPEPVGANLRTLLPDADQPDDFQDLAIWRTVTREIAADLLRGPRTVVVPMTVARADHFGDMVGGLRTAGVAARHFTLVGSRSTIRERLDQRGRPEGSVDWPWRTSIAA